MKELIADRLDEVQREMAQEKQRREEQERQRAFNNALRCNRAQLELISAALGRNILNGDDLVKAAQTVTTLSVEGVDITLEPYLLQRLKSRCHPTKDFGEFLSETVVKQLAGFAGA